uniref:Uncharacterized protein n=1 Tax=Lygus hesperus TaxID=30085 RepID=A0A146LCJ1_LYGHE
MFTNSCSTMLENYFFKSNMDNSGRAHNIKIDSLHYLCYCSFSCMVYKIVDHAYVPSVLMAYFCCLHNIMKMFVVTAKTSATVWRPNPCKYLQDNYKCYLNGFVTGDRKSKRGMAEMGCYDLHM